MTGVVTIVTNAIDEPVQTGSGILPPLLAGREHETATFQERIERTRQGQPEHTALLGDWAIGKTTPADALATSPTARRRRRRLRWRTH